jgi:phosphoglycolate phosphatase
MSRSFKLLVFDWDGTLMDSEARIVACATAAAVDIGLEVPTKDAVRNIIGLGLKEAMLVLFPGSDEAEVARFVERYRHHFLHVDETPSELFPGAFEVLNSLAEHDYFLAVATGKGRPGLDKVLRETGLEPLFHVTRCADEAFSKPHPEMLQQIMDALGVEGSETLMIGDTEYDLQMASNAGANSLAVSYGTHEVERLMRHGPLGCLDSITELTGWLEKRKRP